MQRVPHLMLLLALPCGACAGAPAERPAIPPQASSQQIPQEHDDPEPAVEGAPLAPTPGDLDPAEWRLSASLEGHYELAFRPRPGGSIPRNEEVDLDLLVFRDGKPLAGARVTIRGWMPDHRHGFVHAPHLLEDQGGRYAVEGLLLHMRGRWQLFFEVTAEGTRDTVTFELEV